MRPGIEVHQGGPCRLHEPCSANAWVVVCCSAFRGSRVHVVSAGSMHTLHQGILCMHSIFKCMQQGRFAPGGRSIRKTPVI